MFCNLLWKRIPLWWLFVMNHWGLWQINKCPKIQYSIHTQKYPSHCLRNTKWLIAENAQHFKIVHDTQTQWWIISRLPGHRVSVKSDYTRGRKFCDTFSKWYFFWPYVEVPPSTLRFLQYCTMILQRLRIIVRDAGFEPGTSAPEVIGN